MQVVVARPCDSDQVMEMKPFGVNQNSTVVVTCHEENTCHSEVEIDRHVGVDKVRKQVAAVGTAGLSNVHQT